MSVVVDSIYRVGRVLAGHSWRAMAHVFQKGRKRISPAFAYPYAAAAINSVEASVLIFAATNHILPNFIFRRALAIASVAVLVAGMPATGPVIEVDSGDFALTAFATDCDSLSKLVTNGDNLISAIASAQPKRASFSSSRRAEDGKAAKSETDQLEFWFGHGRSVDRNG